MNPRQAGMSRSQRVTFVVALSACLLILASCNGGNDDQVPIAGPTIGPPGFKDVKVVGGLDQPTNFAFAPDGRIFIAGQQGDVRIVREGVLLPTPLIELRVNSYAQHGLFGLELDPNFETNGYVYLFFTYEHDAADPSGPKTGRLIRVTADGDVAALSSAIVLLGSVVGTASRPSCEDFAVGADCLPADGCCHVGGGLRFASDGKLFVSTGDGASAEKLQQQQRSQDLDSLAGKILRINPDGSAPTDNPFFTGDATENRSKVWAYGLREPFRFGLQPGTDLPFIGDIGSWQWEEINIAYPGANFGWPCYEGRTRNYGSEQLPICQDLFLLPFGAVAFPLVTYAIGFGAAVIGGDFALTYPDPYAGAYFYGDWAESRIAYLMLDKNNSVVDMGPFATGTGGPVALRTGPDGEIYYLAWHTGELRHIRWLGGNRGMGQGDGF